MIRRLLLALLPALLLLLTACGSSPAEENTTTTASGEPTTTTEATTETTTASGGEVLVVATTTILGDVVAGLVGDAARVEVLIPVGADPHDFQPSAQQAALLREADLVVANGLGLEEGLIDTIEAAEEEGANVLEVAPLVDPIPFSAGGDDAHREEHDSEDHASEEHGEHDHGDEHSDEGHAEDEHDHAHGDEDPHFWQDPLRMAMAVELITAELGALDTGLPASEWNRRGEEYVGQLEALHAEIEELVAAVPADRRKLVTNHEAFGYFADRYGFEVVGVVIPGGSTLAEPSAGELAGLVETLEHEGVQAIFAETINPSALAEAVAAELGEDVEVVGLYSDSLGEPGSEADSYPGMLRENARRIVEALT